MRTLLKPVFLFSLIFSSTFFVCPQDILASTDIDSDITTDTVWDKEGSPYTVSGQVNIATGTTLTISPGVVVLFDYGSEVDVNGKIISNGVSDDKIYFTSIADSTLNGISTDGLDPDLIIPPSPSDYTGFVFNVGSTGEFANTDIKYFDTGISATNALISINNSIFSDGYMPIMVDYSTDFTHNGNTFTNNIYDNIGMTGDLYGLDYTFSKDGAPYILFSDLFVSSGKTLTISPGVILQTDYYKNIYLSGGTLVSNGLPDSNIILEGISLLAFNKSNLDLKNTEIKNVPRVAMQIYGNSTLNMDFDNVHDLSGDGIYAFDNSNINLKNSSINNFGTYGAGITIFNNTGVIIQNSTIDNGGDGIIASNHATIDADHMTIKNCNDVAIISYGSDQYKNNNIKLHGSVITENNMGIFPIDHTNTDISKNSIFGNEFGVFLNSDTPYDFSNNWWGDKSGPQNETNNPDGKGDLVSDGVTFEPWLKRDPTIAYKTPVLIVPGVLGTEISKPKKDGSLEKLWLDLVHNLSDIGDQFMDPLQFGNDLKPTDASLVLGKVIKKETANVGSREINLFNYTDGLILDFKDQGYTENTDIFLFPYDWRTGISDDNIQNLKNKISDIMSENGSEKVDIVAHSTGGLLVKKYVMENPDSNNIDKVVFVGVPNTGAPKAIKTFLQGDNFGNLFLADSEMKKIAENLPVVYDLSPSAEYYKNKGSFVRVVNQKLFSSKKKDLSFDDMTNFLINDHKLNRDAWTNAQNLHSTNFDNYDMRTAGVDVYAIDGCKTGTLGKITEVRSNDIFGNDLISYNAPQMVSGDSTVPFESATNLPINEDNKFYSLNASHGEMLSQDGIRQKIVDIVSGIVSSSSSLITTDISKCKLGGRAISVYSPLSIDITDQNGDHSGLVPDGSSIENNIPNADYEIFGEHKFVYLPTDEGQNYNIKISGTGDGFFTLTDATISDNQITGMQVFNQISVTTLLKGNINIGDVTTLSLDTNNDGVVDQILQPTANLDGSDAIDFDPAEFANSLKNKDTEKTNTPIAYASGNHITISSQISTTTELSDAIIPDFIRNPDVYIPNKQEIVYNDNVDREINDCLFCNSGFTPKSIDVKENLATDTQLTASVQESKIPTNPFIFIGSLISLSFLIFISRKFIRR